MYECAACYRVRISFETSAFSPVVRSQYLHTLRVLITFTVITVMSRFIIITTFCIIVKLDNMFLLFVYCVYHPGMFV